MILPEHHYTMQDERNAELIRRAFWPMVLIISIAMNIILVVKLIDARHELGFAQSVMRENLDRTITFIESNKEIK